MATGPREPDVLPTLDRAAAELLGELLRRTHLSAPSDLAGVIADQAASIGAHDLVLYLIDYDQDTLMPLPAGAEGPPGAALRGRNGGRTVVQHERHPRGRPGGAATAASGFRCSTGPSASG